MVLDLIKQIETPGSPHWSLEQLQAELSSGMALGIKDSNELQAFVIYRSPDQDTFEITYLACSKCLQRTGLMSKLFIEFLRILRAANVGDLQVWLEVHEKNYAGIHFYEKFGFKQVGRRPNYYIDRGTALLYSLKF